MGKLTISMGIFNSFLYVYQRVSWLAWGYGWHMATADPIGDIFFKNDLLVIDGLLRPPGFGWGKLAQEHTFPGWKWGMTPLGDGNFHRDYMVHQWMDSF